MTYKFHPGSYIKDEMKAREWSIQDVSVKSGMHEHLILSVIEERRRITGLLALGFGKAFDVHPDLFTNLQCEFDKKQQQARHE